jgi:hypothetical protein
MFIAWALQNSVLGDRYIDLPKNTQKNFKTQKKKNTQKHIINKTTI